MLGRLLAIFSCLFVYSAQAGFISSVDLHAGGIVTDVYSPAFPSVSTGDHWSVNLFASNPTSDLASNPDVGLFGVSWSGTLQIGRNQINIDERINQALIVRNGQGTQGFTEELHWQVNFSSGVFLDSVQLNGFDVRFFDRGTPSITGDDFEDILDYRHFPTDVGSLNLTLTNALDYRLIAPVSTVRIGHISTPSSQSLFS